MKKLFAVSMFVMWVAALNLPEETGVLGAILATIPYLWLSVLMFANLFWDGGKGEKHHTE